MEQSVVQTKEILALAVEMGEAMLSNGAEIYRVEDTVSNILKAFGVEEFDVYVISNGIFASANENKEDACSMVRNVPLGSVNLGKISMLNQLARDICNFNCSIYEAWNKLEACKKLADYSVASRVFFCGLGSGCFCYLFGGNPLDSVFAFIIGMMEQTLLIACRKHKFSKFTTNIFASLFVTIISFAIILTKLPIHQDNIIIGSIMPLVPGIAFTTSIRDFYNGDYLSGTIHIVDAILTAVCIAIGATLPFYIFHTWGGVF